jgi:hypothetical protein
MAATPESRVKVRIHSSLFAAEAFAVNYIGGQYANNGTPDILACLGGKFVGIEAKAGRGRLTQLQIKSLRDIHRAGGSALVINETNIDQLPGWLATIRMGGQVSNYEAFIPKEKPQEPINEPTLRTRQRNVL